MESSASGCGPVASSCEHSNEPSGSLKDGKFLDYLSVSKLLKNSAPCI
jgi:hypothetical protein